MDGQNYISIAHRTYSATGYKTLNLTRMTTPEKSRNHGSREEMTSDEMLGWVKGPLHTGSSIYSEILAIFRKDISYRNEAHFTLEIYFEICYEIYVRTCRKFLV